MEHERDDEKRRNRVGTPEAGRHDDHPCHECPDEGEEIREDVLERSFDVDRFESALPSDHVAAMFTTIRLRPPR